MIEEQTIFYQLYRQKNKLRKFKQNKKKHFLLNRYIMFMIQVQFI